jgi:hypothetical protein
MRPDYHSLGHPLRSANRGLSTPSGCHSALCCLLHVSLTNFETDLSRPSPFLNDTYDLWHCQGCRRARTVDSQGNQSSNSNERDHPTRTLRAARKASG